MQFHLSAVDQYDQQIEFFLDIDQIERGFNLSNQLIDEGNKQLSAQLIDEQSVIELPIEQFDKDPSIEEIANLEEEWHSILSRPFSSATGFNLALLDMTNKRLKICESHIARFESLTGNIKALLINLRQMDMSPLTKRLLVDKYEQILYLYQGQIDKGSITHRHLVDLIYRLS